jgi:hypothetical protein
LIHRYLYLALVVLFIKQVFANNPQRIFQTTWGENDNQVQIRVEPDARYGPQAFRVVEDQYIILDGENGKLKIFGHPGFKSANTVNRFARDFYFNSPSDYTLLIENKIELFENNQLSKQIAINHDQVILPLTENSDPDQPVRFSDGERSFIRPDKFLKKKRPEISVIRTSSKHGEIQSANQLLFDVDFPDGNLASLRYVGQDAAGHIFVELELFIQRMPLKIERQIRAFTQDGKSLATFKIPINNYCYVFRDIEIDPKGNVYQMYFNPEGMEIWKWDWPDSVMNGSPVIFQMPDYGEEYPAVPIMEEEQQSGLEKPQDLPQVTPEVALSIADTYVALDWECSAENLTNGVITDPSGNVVQTPTWLYVGTIHSMPYKWGGFDTIESFLQGITAGYYAGDQATSAVSSYARGVDCSGFVSRCWTLPSHYSTRMMDDYIAQPYDSWEQTLPGDVCHREGHVRLIVSHKPDGSIDMVESAGFNWRVSYTNYRYSDLTTYMPRYYINMQGTPGNIPQPLVTSLIEWDTPQLDWTVSGEDQISHYNLYTSNNAVNWNLHETLPPADRNYVVNAPDSPAIYYKLCSVSASNDETEGLPSDGYGIYKPESPNKVLIVDAFDRTSATSGSWGHVYHDFAAVHGQALFNLDIPFETVPNEALTTGDINLANYKAVIWISGDESTADETFSTSEQNIITAYLQQGGKLFVSGSEIGWDLDYKGSTEDKNFYNSILKAEYESDDAGSYVVNGEASTVFSGLTLHYDDGTKGVYQEDYPDAINTINGSSIALKYANGKVAAVTYTGTFNGGSKEGQLFYLAFPFETIYTEAERNALMSAVMNYFDLSPTAIAAADQSQIPAEFRLLQNYPNPFNGSTTIRYFTPSAGEIEMQTFNSNGQKVYSTHIAAKGPGYHDYALNAINWSSGIYFYTLNFKRTSQSFAASGKFILVK